MEDKTLAGRKMPFKSSVGQVVKRCAKRFYCEYFDAALWLLLV